MEKRSENKPRILLTGATGYVGGRLLSRLLDSGFSVRCAARTPESLSHIDHKNAEIVRADLLELETMESALKGIDVAYYLVHSLGSASDFEEKERQCAQNFARAAKNAGVGRIIYLGGLGSG